MKTLHRIAASIVVLCMLCSCTAFAANDFSNSIENTWANYTAGNQSASSGEQLVNGTYRSFEMLYIIDSLWDTSGRRSGQLDTIWSQYESANAAATSVTDQAANGAYRTFEAAYLLALMADTSGAFASALDNVWSSYETSNTAATSASQRLVNGSYRTFEAAYILAQLLDTQGTYTRNLRTIWSTYSSENSAAKSAAAQAANGFYRTFEALYIAASLIDTQGLYAESLDAIWDSYEAADAKADSYIKRQVNGAYRSFETLYVIAQLLNGTGAYTTYGASVVTPKNGEVLIAPDYTETCPLQVTAPRGQNAYVYLRYRRTVSESTTSRERKSGARSPYESDLAFYVRAGKTVEVNVPVGQYKVYYALGGDFYGTQFLFGANSACYAVNDLASFYTDGWYANGNTYTLDGSEASLISQNDFPVK